jgi:hypothetical protein
LACTPTGRRGKISLPDQGSARGLAARRFPGAPERDWTLAARRYPSRLFILSLVMILAVAVPVAAKPPGDSRDPDVGKQLYKFNVIAVPNDSWTDSETCENNGSRIFFERGNGSTIGTIKWELWPNLYTDFRISDCDATKDATAVVQANESIRFWVTVRLLGPKTSNLNLVCTEVIDAGVDDLCVIGSANLQRGATTKIMSNVFDNAYEEVLWSLSGDWRILDVRIWEKI